VERRERSRQNLAAAAAQRQAVPGHQRPDALEFGRACRLRLPVLDYVQAVQRAGRVREEGGAWLARRVRQHVQEDGHGRQRPGIRAGIPFLKEYVVFNAEQCEGLPAHYYQLAEPPKETIERIAHADAFFVNTGIEIRTGGNRAYYAIGPDYVQMPPLETFRDAESHAATLAHELTHATRHPSRLDRDLGRKRWGDSGYAMEELVAELGSAFLCADLRITPEVRDDHASYIHEWLKVLQDDKRAIFAAASHASKAVDYLLGLQPVAS
jgi:antirestriction protein ArdC